jgi:RNA polymerase sigma factor (sigma-70 family)
MVRERAYRYARDVQTLFVTGALGGLGDAELLDVFLEHERDRAAAERAFAALVDRHGPMVLRVCAGVLGDVHEAQDVCQATFLVLAQRARSVRRRDSVASWLHGVAMRLSAKVKRAAARRRAHERRGGEIMTARRGEQGGPPPEDSWEELHEELGRLPEKYREPIVLCHLEGLTQDQVARRLGWPIGTVQSRLARGRDRLRDRLVRRGVTLSATVMAGGGGSSVEAALTAAWVESTARAAVQVAAGRSIAGSVPAAVLLLWHSGSRSLLMTRLLIAGGVMATVGVLAAASAAPGWVAQDPSDVARGQVDRAQPKTAKPPSIAGHWIVLYLAGTAAGKRQAYVEPGMMVHITEDTISLPLLAGDHLIDHPRKMEYSTGREGGLLDPVIDAVGGHGRDRAKILARGIYRVAGDNLVICYDSDQGGTRPTSFAAATETETLLILRRERPVPEARPLGRIDGYLAPPRPTKRLQTGPLR